MNDAIKQFLLDVVTAVECHLPHQVRNAKIGDKFLSFTVNDIRFHVDVLPEQDMKAYLRQDWKPGLRLYNGRYRCGIDLPSPISVPGVRYPTARIERRIPAGKLHDVSAEFAAAVVQAAGPFREKRRPVLVVNNS
jgi:hypothetical protein